jgi:hypothetical protein
MTRPVLTLVPGEGPHVWPVLLAVAGSLGAARAAVSAGADIIDLGDAAAADIAAFLAELPGVPFCAADDRAAMTRQAASARIGAALLICDDLAAARASGLPADRLVVRAPPGAIAAVRRAGYAAMVDADQAAADATAASPAPAGLAGCVAAAALSSWLGAALVRTRFTPQVRRGLDMAATIRGIRPPARTVRGLA